MRVLGIDPGQKGAFVEFNGTEIKVWPMPVKQDGKHLGVDFAGVEAILMYNFDHIFLERAMSMGMGSTGAFNYGRGFAALEIAISQSGTPCTYVEPGKWTKVMHDGISSDLKPKAKSLIAVKRLYPKLVSLLPKGPKSGKFDEGVIDALLIAGYGLRHLNGEHLIPKDVKRELENLKMVKRAFTDVF